MPLAETWERRYFFRMKSSLVLSLISALTLVSISSARADSDGDTFDPNRYEFNAKSSEGPLVTVIYRKVESADSRGKLESAHTVILRVAFEKFTTMEKVETALFNDCKDQVTGAVETTVVGKSELQYSSMEDLFFLTFPGRVMTKNEPADASQAQIVCSQRISVSVDGAALTNPETQGHEFTFKM